MRPLHVIAVVVTSLTSASAAAQDGEIDIQPVDAAAEEAPPTDAQRAQATSAELAGQAEEAFGAGEYERAIELLKQSYEADHNPNMLYNIARVYEEAGQPENALEYYRRFVVAPNVDLDYRREALQSSEAIEQRMEATRQAQAAQNAAPTQEAAARDSGLLRPAPFPTTSAMRPLGFTLAGIGGAALIGGAVVGVVALRRQRDFNDAQTLEARRAAGRSARDLATTADALYISGAVLVVTGIVTAFASPRRAERDKASEVSVMVRRDGVGAAWTLRF